LPCLALPCLALPCLALPCLRSCCCGAIRLGAIRLGGWPNVLERSIASARHVRCAVRWYFAIVRGRQGCAVCPIDAACAASARPPGLGCARARLPFRVSARPLRAPSSAASTCRRRSVQSALPLSHQP
jgi:hypothetical protein